MRLLLAAAATAGLLLNPSTALTLNHTPKSSPQLETRSLDTLYKAALSEGGLVTCSHGGDESNRGDAIKQAFETRFPGMTLNITIDLSKYHDGNIDDQLASRNVHVDSVILQTTHDFTRWAKSGALMSYAPLGFEKIYPEFKDRVSAHWYGLRIFSWSLLWNAEKLKGMEEIRTFQDFLKPELKDKIVLTYPNDDDAVLYAFHLIMKSHGTKWFDALLKQNPRWVRGSATPLTLIQQSDNNLAATFTSAVGIKPPKGVSMGFPTDGQFVSWAQRGAILKDAPHPEGAKLFHAFLLSREFQDAAGWSVRQDAQPPKDFKYPDIMHMPNTNPTTFATFMADRAHVERLKLWFENRLGTAQGLSPLVDGI